jgi:hypothetical protein
LVAVVEVTYQVVAVALTSNSTSTTLPMFVAVVRVATHSSDLKFDFAIMVATKVKGGVIKVDQRAFV